MKCISSSRYIFVICTVIIFFFGCGISEKKLSEIEDRIKVLQDQGAPDSLLSSVKIFLFQIKSSKKIGNTGLVRKNSDSLKIYIDKAEINFKAALEKAKPFITTTIRSIQEKKKDLTGLQLKIVDSILVRIDLLTSKNWLLPAQELCFRLDTLLPHLLTDEGLSQKYRKKVMGRWVSVQVPQGGFKGKETRDFTFKRDNTFQTIETMKGQTSEYSKEDWKFINTGTWAMRGDTIKMYVERERCTKQIYWNYKPVGKKYQWVKTVAPTYDSTITNGKKDRYLTYSYIKDSFKKRK